MHAHRSKRDRKSVRWFALGASGLGLGVAWLLACVLGSSSARAPSAPVIATVDAETIEVAPHDDGTPRPRREPMRTEPDALVARVNDTAEVLAAALESPEYEDARWRAEVRGHARDLGAAALPALEALLADDTRSVEEHVAASELVAALRRP